MNLKRNQHGHPVLTITGEGLTGMQEVNRLKDADFLLSDWARSSLLSEKDDGYDARHRLVGGRQYRLPIIFGKAIPDFKDRSTTNLLKHAATFGYQRPLAGVMPRVRELLSDEDIGELGTLFDVDNEEAPNIRFIAALHEPITDSDGCTNVLDAGKYGSGRWFHAVSDAPGQLWRADGAYVFFEPENV